MKNKCGFAFKNMIFFLGRMSTRKMRRCRYHWSYKVDWPLKFFNKFMESTYL